MRRENSERLAAYEDDDDERQVFHFDDGRDRNIVLDTPLQRGFLSAAVAAVAVLGVAALLAS
jgi:hypothetical protein